MSETNDLKKKLWALHIGGESLAKMLQPKIEFTKSLDGSDVLTSGAGFKATLDMMIKVHAKNQDRVFEELISMLPGISAFGTWMEKIPCFKVTEEEFEGLSRMGHIF